MNVQNIREKFFLDSNILITEDMQRGRVIRDLKIVNPFV